MKRAVESSAMRYEVPAIVAAIDGLQLRKAVRTIAIQVEDFESGTVAQEPVDV
jgi:hypothetical protein